MIKISFVNTGFMDLNCDLKKRRKKEKKRKKKKEKKKEGKTNKQTKNGYFDDVCVLDIHIFMFNCCFQYVERSFRLNKISVLHK